MELNDCCSPDLLNVRRQNDFAGNRKINNDGVVFDAQHWADGLQFEGLRSKLLRPRDLLALHGARDRSPFLDPKSGGADRDRTGDLLLAKQALSQLSYSPMISN